MLNFLPLANRRAGLSTADYCHAASMIGCDVSMVRAVDAVESAGAGFLPSGRPKILFEGHLFHKYTGGKFDKSHPTISYPKWTKVHYLGGEAEYSRLKEAYQLDPTAALRAASWQRFQILGDNFRLCGYASPEEFVKAMFESEDNALDAFISYIKADGLAPAMCRHDAVAVAKGYNGTEYYRNHYDTKIHNADTHFVGMKINCGALSPTAPTPIDVALPADAHEHLGVGLNNTSLDGRYKVPPAPTLDDKTVDQTSSTPTPEPLVSNQNTSPALPANPGTAGTASGEDDEPTSSSFVGRLITRIKAGADKITDYQDKADSVTSFFDRFSGNDSLKSLATFVAHHVVQATLLLATWLLSVPFRYYLVTAIVIASVTLAYLGRQMLLGVVREIFGRNHGPVKLPPSGTTDVNLPMTAGVPTGQASQ